MHRAFFLIFVIGIFSGTLASAEVELNEDGGSMNPKLVYVEPTNISQIRVDDEFALLPYRERRHDWGSTISFGYVYYDPVNYQPNFSHLEFDGVYKSPDTPLMELQYSLKRNVSWGSFGAEVAGGLYVNKSDVDENLVDSTLTLYPVRLGMNIALDALAPDPLFVPFASLGAYTMIYREAQGSSSKNGNSQVSAYFDGGIEIRIDGLDRRSARIAYRETRLESTYVYLSARKYLSSGSDKDPDFGTDLSGAAGLRLEF